MNEHSAPPSLLDLDFVRIDPSLARRVPATLALRRGLVLFGERDGNLLLACRDAEDQSAIEVVERIASTLGRGLMTLVAEPSSIDRALHRVHPGLSSAADSLARARDGATQDPTNPVHLVERLLADAISEQASDIHLEPASDACSVRFRVDGVLEERAPIANDLAAGILNRLKVLGGLDIAERRLPQDGRFSWSFGGGASTSVDVRLAILPVRHGERVTLRILAQNAAALTLKRVGMSDSDFELFRAEIERPHGMLLLTGPTGSGKTTTLYAALRGIETRKRNVLTIEDPVEYGIPGVSQAEVDSDHGVSFASALRSVLRHDPDVILVGEIRDLETADTAIKASLTGHLLLSTLHTNSAVSAVTRLHDMGIPRFLIAATARLYVAQRLVRRLCAYCRRAETISAAQAKCFGEPELEGRMVASPQGCGFCRGTGYAGRIGLFELFRPDAEITSRIAAGASEDELRHMASERGQRTLRDDALDKVLASVTSISEALRAVEMS